MFRWVAWFTGSKNAIKGAGFFIGGFLLKPAGFRPALWLMAAMLAAVLADVLMSLPRTRARRRRRSRFVNCSPRPAQSTCSRPRASFCSASRDVWFVVGLPVFLYTQGWQYMEVAGYLAAWTLGYGLVQAIAPMVVRRSADGLSREMPEARLWGAALTAIPVALVLMLRARLPISPALLVISVLGVFGFAFAVISSLHSYLILAYAGTKKAAEDVGFYYAANAAGRLIGILLSGLLTEYGSLAACLWGSAAMLALCLALVLLLPLRI